MARMDHKEPQEEVRMQRIMFLGGDLDHTIRRVPVTSALNVPPEVYKRHVPQTLSWMQQHKEDPLPVQHYYRHRVSAGTDSWFCYILPGHEPSPSALLDTCPFVRT